METAAGPLRRTEGQKRGRILPALLSRESGDSGKSAEDPGRPTSFAKHALEETSNPITPPLSLNLTAN